MINHYTTNGQKIIFLIFFAKRNESEKYLIAEFMIDDLNRDYINLEILND